MSGISAPIFGNRDKASSYVQYMTHHAQLDETLEGLVEFGAPVAASNTDLRASTAIAAGARQNFTTQLVVNALCGRSVNITVTGAGVVTLFGRDYLNQPISQAVTFAGVGTTPTTKAFKYLDGISCTTAISISLGNGPTLGLPIVTGVALQEILNGGAAAALGTLTAPDLTTPATTTTGDPRGRYAPNSTMNGTNLIAVKCRFRDDTADGMHGVPQV